MIDARELVERVLVERQPRLVGVGVDAVERDVADARRVAPAPSGESRLMMAGESSALLRRAAARPCRGNLV